MWYHVGRDTSSQNTPKDSSSLKSSSAADEEVKHGDEGRHLTESGKEVAPPLAPALAAQQTDRAESALGQAILRLLGIKKRLPRVDPDAVSGIKLSVGRIVIDFRQDRNSTQYLGRRGCGDSQTDADTTRLGEYRRIRP